MCCSSSTSRVSLRRKKAMRHPSKRSSNSALLDSVRIHLASDAPLATLCSGGVDSGFVTACVAAQRPRTPAYVANVVANVSDDIFEGARARRVSEYLGVELRQVDVGREDLLRLWPMATWFADQPNYTASEMPMLAIARVCRATGIKVLLSGEGADELFGGYQRHEETYDMWRAQRTPWRRDASDLHLRPFHRMVTWPPGAPPSIAYGLDAELHVRGVALFEKLKGVRAARGSRLLGSLPRRSLRPLAWSPASQRPHGDGGVDRGTRAVPRKSPDRYCDAPARASRSIATATANGCSSASPARGFRVMSCMHRSWVFTYRTTRSPLPWACYMMAPYATSSDGVRTRLAELYRWCRRTGMRRSGF